MELLKEDRKAGLNKGQRRVAARALQRIERQRSKEAQLTGVMSDGSCPDGVQSKQTKDDAEIIFDSSAVPLMSISPAHFNTALSFLKAELDELSAVIGLLGLLQLIAHACLQETNEMCSASRRVQ